MMSAQCRLSKVDEVAGGESAGLSPKPESDSSAGEASGFIAKASNADRVAPPTCCDGLATVSFIAASEQ